MKKEKTLCRKKPESKTHSTHKDKIRQSDARLSSDLGALVRMRTLSTRILDSTGMQPLLEEIMDAAVEVVRAERGTLQVLEGVSLRIVSHHGHQKPFLDFFESAENVVSVCGEATRRGERVVVPDIETSPLFVGTPSLPVLREAGVRAVQSTPIRTRTGALLGILTTQWGVPHSPSEQDLWRLDLLVRQAADLIEQAKAEASLRESERRYRQLFDTMTEGFLLIEMILDESGKPVSYRYLDANPALANLTHLKREQIVGRDVREILPAIEPYWIEAFGRVAMTGRPEHIEQFSKDLNGWYDVYVFCPEPGRAALIYTNTTARKRADEENKRLLAAVQEERDRLSALIGSINDEIWFADAEKRFTLVNPAGAREFRTTPGESLKVEELAESLGVCRPDGTPRPVDEAPPLRALRGEVIKNQEERLRTPATGELRYRQVSAAPVRDARGAIIGSVSVVRDITENKRVEEALRESEDRLRFAHETSHTGAWDLDLIDHTAHRSLEHDRIFGYKELLPKWTYEMFLDHVLPEDRASVDSKFRHAMDTSSDWSFECRILRIDGETRWIWAAGRHRPDAEGRLNRMAGIVQDITERKRAEQALFESENRFRTMADAIPQLAWVARADGWFYWYNRRWYEYTGTTPEQMEGWGWQRVHHPDELPKVLERWKRSLDTGEPFDMVFPLRGADGVFRPFLTRVMPLKDAAGNVLQWFGTNTDITERQQVEDALRRTAEELARSNRELEQFAYVCAHDLQEPLRQVRAFARLLQERHADRLEGKAEEYLRFVHEGAAHMSSLVSSLLSYSRLGGRLNRRPVACRAAVDAAMANLRPAVEEAGAAVTFDDLPTVTADLEQLVTLFTNLIGNAIKFRFEGIRPEVHVGCRSDGRGWLFWVRDNGIGIDAEYHDKVFLIFQRLHTRAKYSGTGIGLAICKKIVELHGGKIWIESKVGEGATFFFSLPEG